MDSDSAGSGVRVTTGIENRPSDGKDLLVLAGTLRLRDGAVLGHRVITVVVLGEDISIDLESGEVGEPVIPAVKGKLLVTGEGTLINDRVGGIDLDDGPVTASTVSTFVFTGELGDEHLLVGAVSVEDEVLLLGIKFSSTIIRTSHCVRRERVTALDGGIVGEVDKIGTGAVSNCNGEAELISVSTVIRDSPHIVKGLRGRTRVGLVLDGRRGGREVVTVVADLHGGRSGGLSTVVGILGILLNKGESGLHLIDNVDVVLLSSFVSTAISGGEDTLNLEGLSTMSRDNLLALVDSHVGALAVISSIDFVLGRPREVSGSHSGTVVVLILGDTMNHGRVAVLKHHSLSDALGVTTLISSSPGAGDEAGSGAASGILFRTEVNNDILVEASSTGIADMVREGGDRGSGVLASIEHDDVINSLVELGLLSVLDVDVLGTLRNESISHKLVTAGNLKVSIAHSSRDLIGGKDVKLIRGTLDEVNVLRTLDLKVVNRGIAGRTGSTLLGGVLSVSGEHNVDTSGSNLSFKSNRILLPGVGFRVLTHVVVERVGSSGHLIGLDEGPPRVLLSFSKG